MPPAKRAKIKSQKIFKTEIKVFTFKSIKIFNFLNKFYLIWKIKKAKAILNKTKIDTEFISKLIANKDPNDKRYDPNEINKLRLLSHSYQNFAVKLLMRLFTDEEIIGRNVYGRNYSGDKSIMKQPLDPERINFIKETVLKLTKTNNPEQAWASCVIAMNRKMVDINNKFVKKNKNK